MKTKLLLSLFTILFTLPSWGVEIYSRRLTTANGLPDNNVRSLAQDAKGFIWMGTPNGLFRFDGYFYTTYKYENEGNLRLLNNNHIEGCYALSDDRMLFREKGGQYSVFDVGRNRFIDMPDEEKRNLFELTRLGMANSEQLSRFRHILEDGGSYINDNLGNLVVIDDKGHIWFIDRKTGENIRLTVFDEQLFPLISSHKYKVMTSEKKGLIWVSTNGCGITLYDRNTREERHIRQESGLISTDYVLDICLDQDDNLWVANEFHGVVYLATAQHATETHLLQPDSPELRSNQVYVMQLLGDSTLLLANTKGDVYEADRQLRHLHQTMTGIDIHAFCTDRQNGLWIGSRRQGVRTPDGQWHCHDKADPLSPTSDNITSLYCDADGNIWMGCEEGQLELIVPKADGTLQFRHFLPEGASPKFIVEDSQGMVWIGAQAGLFSFVPKELMADKGAYRQYLKAEDTRQSDVNCFFEDSLHRIWVGTNGDGVYYTADRGNTFTHLTMNDGLISNDIQSIVSPDGNTFWIATKKGITCYRPADGSCQYVYNEYSLLQNYYADRCACLLPDGRLAFGTNMGVLVYESDKAPTHHPSPPTHHLPLKITDLLINGESTAMMGDNSPLTSSPDDVEEIVLRHDQNSLTFRFSVFNFNTTAGTRYTYWLEGYDKQWSEVSTYSFANYKNLPPGKYVLHIKAYDNRLSSNLERSLVVVISRPWWQTWWACLAYLVLAVAVGWSVYRQLRTVYRLRQRISIEQHLTEYKLQFFTNISHEFRTPLTIIRGAMQRIRATKDIPADLRQPLSNMQKSSDRMMRLINQLLEFRKMQNDKLRLALEETDVVAFVKDIYLSFTDIAENKRISYTFLPTVKGYNMYIDRQHVDKMVFNLLSNAFKYTPTGGSVTVRLTVPVQEDLPSVEGDLQSVEGDLQSVQGDLQSVQGDLQSVQGDLPSVQGDLQSPVTIQVADTGVGIPKEKQGELFQRFMQSTFSNNSIGIGLHLTKALVDVHHGSIRFEENTPQGAIFTISLPTDKQVYAPDDFLQASALTSHPSVQGNLQSVQENLQSPLSVEGDLQSPSVEGDLQSVQGDLQSVQGDLQSPLPEYKELLPQPMNDRRVLVAEDDPDVADFLRQTLSRYFVVDIAMDGAEALSKATAAVPSSSMPATAAVPGVSTPVPTPPDLIVSDVMMPVMDGFELTRRIRKTPATQAIPILLLTALNADEKRLKGIEHGADAYLTKPFDTDLLIATCRQLIEQRDKLRQSYAAGTAGSRGFAIPAPPQIIVDERDKKLLDRMERWLYDRIANPNLSIDDVAQAMGYGRSIFYRKVKALTGQTPADYIRTIRMNRAAVMLREETITVAEVCYKVGISDPHYFTKVFKQQFGISPKKYQKGEKAEPQEKCDS